MAHTRVTFLVHSGLCLDPWHLYAIKGILPVRRMRAIYVSGLHVKMLLSALIR